MFMKNRELRKTSSVFQRALVDLIMCEKISIKDIPFDTRKWSRQLYVSANRVSRWHGEQERAAFIKLIFEDFDKLLKDDKRILIDLVETAMEWDNDILKKFEIETPKDLCRAQ